MATDVLGIELKDGDIVSVAVQDRMLGARQQLAVVSSINGKSIKVKYKDKDKGDHTIVDSSFKVVKVSIK